MCVANWMFGSSIVLEPINPRRGCFPITHLTSVDFVSR
jgi:hypothetical protein